MPSPWGLVPHSFEVKEEECSGIDMSAIDSRQPPISLQWHNITLSSRNGKSILKGISGRANTGELMAIMGPSGAGKSTFLNVLSGFTHAEMNDSITVNGAPRDMRVFRKLSCYIMQDDHLLLHLTVRESIQFSAMLKLPTSVLKQERQKAVDDCLKSLGLSEHQYTRAGELSGGQRKRLSIAQELVSNPPLIFLDEPTSGLDSSTCLQCIQLLKSLAEEGRTVICTIHQPSSRIFELFDQLYILAEGHCVYRGSTKNLIPFLNEQGLFCPTYHNPADFVMEVAAGEHGDWIRKLKTAIGTFDATGGDQLSLADQFPNSDENFKVSFRDSTLYLQETPAENNLFLVKDISLESSFGGYATSSWNQFKVLTYRSVICMLREPMTTTVRFIAHLTVGLLLGMIYYGIGNDASKIFSNLGFLFFSLIFTIYTSMMPTALTFPMEKKIFAREYINSWYSTRMYYLAKTVSEIPFQILFPAFYSSIVYWMTAQPNDLIRFCLFTLSSIMVSLLAQSVGFVVGAATDIQNAVFLSPVVTIPILLFSGFFINLKSIPSYLQWLSYFSYLRFAYHNTLHSIYALDRPELQCDKDVCLLQKPQDFLRELDMEDGNLYIDYAAMWAHFFVLRAISYYVLYYKVIYKRK